MNMLVASVSMLCYVACVVQSSRYSWRGWCFRSSSPLVRTDYHTYENEWSVYLSRKDLYVGEVIIEVICQPPCSQGGSSLSRSSLDCASLETCLNETTCTNVFIGSQVRKHTAICETLLDSRNNQSTIRHAKTHVPRFFFVFPPVPIESEDLGVL